ncbi:hypothetical protein BX600DRAFT_493352 [Xylariales sp. PMI_506]|nr:hypothetical protein BX600DRAFT_493352 [Xylariales sp. PMI_506]
MSKVAITNVLVFDGEAITGPTTVVIDGALISNSSDATGAEEVIDGTGCTLLPGLIDSHVHIRSAAELRQCASFGVTTVCDLGAYPKQLFEELKAVNNNNSDGVAAEYLGSGLTAFPPGGSHAHFHTKLDRDESLKGGASGAEAWVDARAVEGVDFVKIIADEPGFDQATLDALAACARARGKLTVAHGTHYGAYERALAAGVDVLTHVPLERVVADDMIGAMKATREGGGGSGGGGGGTAVSPTLLMMRLMVGSEHFDQDGADFRNCLESVRRIHDAGVPVLAGTDSNSLDMPVLHGASLHDEMAALVEAGLTPASALQAATSAIAKHFRLGDRGWVRPGLKADLVLVEGNPTVDIADSKKIKKVWRDGVEVQKLGVVASSNQ